MRLSNTKVSSISSGADISPTCKTKAALAKGILVDRDQKVPTTRPVCDLDSASFQKLRWQSPNLLAPKFAAERSFLKQLGDFGCYFLSQRIEIKDNLPDLDPSHRKAFDNMIPVGVSTTSETPKIGKSKTIFSSWGWWLPLRNTGKKPPLTKGPTSE